MIRFRKLSRMVGIGLASAASLLLISCASGSGATAQPTLADEPTVPAEPTATNEPDISNTYTRLLDQIPDLPETRAGVYLNDFTFAVSLAGMEIPGDDANHDVVLDYWGSLHRTPMGIAGGPWASGMGHYGPEFIKSSQHRGYDQRHVTASAWSEEESQVYEVLHGRFDPDEFARGTECAECQQPGQRPVMMSRQGLEWYSWSEGYEQHLGMRLALPVFDFLGRGGNWLVQDDAVIRTIARDDMSRMIDTQTGSAGSLGDLDDFIVLANAMMDLNAYTVYLSTDTMQKSWDIYYRAGGYGFSSEQETALRAKTAEFPALRPYTTYALGSGLDEEGPYVAAVFLHTNSQDAVENSVRMKQVVGELTTILDQKPWSSIFSGVETEADGLLMKAKLRRNSGAPIWQEMLDMGEPLFAHE